MIQQLGVCSSSLVLHKSLNLLVSFAVLWQKLHAEPAVFYCFGNYVRLTKQPLNQKHCFFFF